MGTLRSLHDMTGTQLPTIILGQPLRDGDWFLWDDSVIPNGVIDEDGTITVD